MPALIDRTGETNINKCGRRMFIVKYDSNKRVLVEFEGGDRVLSKYKNFSDGTINILKRKSRKPENRSGETSKTIYGTEMIIIEYNNSDDILVQFQDENKCTTRANYKNFSIGSVQNPYDKTVHGVGYLGEGRYKSRNKEGKIFHDYSVWASMMCRCYDKKYQKKEPSYIGCSVDPRWHNFQNFAIWYKDNFYQIANKKMQLDKDILLKGNKIYSPETCVFVTQELNLTFPVRSKYRGKWPIGVHFSDEKKKFVAHSVVAPGEKGKFLGYFKTPEEAFAAYKKCKESLIKIIADQQRLHIPDKLYQALINYRVEIGD